LSKWCSNRCWGEVMDIPGYWNCRTNKNNRSLSTHIRVLDTFDQYSINLYGTASSVSQLGLETMQLLDIACDEIPSQFGQSSSSAPNNNLLSKKLPEIPTDMIIVNWSPSHPDQNWTRGDVSYIISRTKSPNKYQAQVEIQLTWRGHSSDHWSSCKRLVWMSPAPHGKLDHYREGAKRIRSSRDPDSRQHEKRPLRCAILV